MRVRLPLPSLIHGISQLNKASRQVVHARDCVNTWPTIKDGDQKRPPLIHVAKLFDGDFGDCYVHGMDRSDTERYMLALKFDDGADSGLICGLDGTLYEIHERDTSTGNYTAALFAYLATSNTYDPHAFIRALTVEDYTYIVNRNRAVTMSSSTATANTSGLGHIYVRGGNAASEYKVRVVLTAAGGSPYTIRPASITANGTTAVTATIKTPLTTDKFAIGNSVTISGATYDADLNGTWTITSIPSSTTFTFSTTNNITAGTPTTNLGSWTKTGSLAHDLYAVTSQIVDNTAAAFPVADGDKGQKVWDRFYSSGAAAPGTVGPHTNFLTSVKTEDIAQHFVDKLTESSIVTGSPASYGDGVVPNGVITATRQGSVVAFQVASGTLTGLEFSTSQGDTLMHTFIDEAPSSTILPEIFTHGHTLRIVGSSASDDDDFYVKFVADLGSGFGKGTWEESIAPGSEYTFKTSPFTGASLATQPFALIKRTGDGANPASVALGETFFSFEPLQLDSRLVGDETSNPDPSFVSTTGFSVPADPNAGFAIARQVQDVAYFQDRLVFLSGENVSTSEVSEYLNFFRTTVRAVPDSDPIDVAFTPDTVSKLHSSIPFAGRMVIFSGKSQHQLLGQPTLTPNTVEASEISRYTNDPGARPVAYEDGIIFPVEKGNFSGLSLLAPNGQTESTFTASDLTLQVPNLIEGRVRQIAVTTNSSIVAVLGDGDTSSIYILKQHREGEKVIQSAWVRFSISGADIQGMHFFDEKLYILSQRSQGLFLEYLDLSVGVSDAGRDYWLHLDRRCDQDTVVSVTPGATSTVTLPYDVETGSVIELVREDTLTRYVANSTPGSPAVSVATNLTGVDFVIGKKYTSTHELHRPEPAQVDDNGRKLILDQSTAVVALEVRYENTSYIKGVSGSYSTPVGSSTVAFQVPRSGKLVFGTSSRLDTPFAVSLQNDTPFPHSLVSAEWILNATVRSKGF